MKLENFGPSRIRPKPGNMEDRYGNMAGFNLAGDLTKVKVEEEEPAMGLNYFERQIPIKTEALPDEALAKAIKREIEYFKEDLGRYALGDFLLANKPARVIEHTRGIRLARSSDGHVVKSRSKPKKAQSTTRIKLEEQDNNGIPLGPAAWVAESRGYEKRGEVVDYIRNIEEARHDVFGIEDGSANIREGTAARDIFKWHLSHLDENHDFTKNEIKYFQLQVSLHSAIYRLKSIEHDDGSQSSPLTKLASTYGQYSRIFGWFANILKGNGIWTSKTLLDEAAMADIYEREYTGKGSGPPISRKYMTPEEELRRAVEKRNYKFELAQKERREAKGIKSEIAGGQRLKTKKGKRSRELDYGEELSKGMREPRIKKEDDGCGDRDYAMET
ncbi:hypothetical protein B0O99DRAFT_680988 [Bisporella sp. PMI_857]|nr:hypothetical protein B0O99DRAFT_680988 [Bisporella sp. PMI_857]